MSTSDTQKPRARRLSAKTLRLGLLTAGLLGGSLLLALGCAEIAVRLVAPQQLILLRPDLWQPADTVGWQRRPDIDIEVNTGERTVRVRTDGHGFRVGAARPRAERSVLLLGDSFMEALQVDHEQSFAGLLEAGLPGALGTSVAIRNAGVGGWDPNQYFLFARSELARRAYDLVVVAVYVGNDMVGERRDFVPPRAAAVRHRFRIPRGFGGSEIKDAVLYPVNDLLEVRSHLFILTRTRLRSLRMRLGLDALNFPSVYFREMEDSPRWEATARILTDLADEASAHGAEYLVILVPDAIQVAPDRLATFLRGYDIDPQAVDLEQPNRLLRAHLEAHGVTVLDPLAAFREAHSGGARLHGAVDAHFTPEGHALLTELVQPTIASLLADGPSAGATGR